MRKVCAGLSATANKMCKVVKIAFFNINNINKLISSFTHCVENQINHRSPLFIVLNAGSGDKKAASVQSILSTLFDDADQPYVLFMSSPERSARNDQTSY